ncbi:UDP-N-acetylglucosamine 2-epimerase (non-hydrolyzing) [Candidatus Woesebacteria bacterium]|nr:UDP-N-acetylglucosamine 2-epimerase (non-hydrolyzing) [Candidatus Woesebacteria bacterium]
MLKVAVIIGTRPDVIKLTPVINELKKRNNVTTKIISTSQHTDLLEPFLDIFKITPDYDLKIMKKNQTLIDTSSRIIKKLGILFFDLKPDIVLVQGDTNTAVSAGLAAYYNRIDIGHIEAGLRTFDKYNPFPEEMNRKLLGSLADIHFAPTKLCKKNLISEGVLPKYIHITGNTVVDSLLETLNKNVQEPHILKHIKGKIILVTCHRRESFGKGLRNISKALHIISRNYNDINIVLPLHPNPNVQKVFQNLNGATNIHLVNPLDYLSFVKLMEKSYLILTDSGGIQEETPSLDIPVLVLRETTERPEGIEAGCSMLVGTDTTNIVNKTTKLLNDQKKYNEMAKAKNPYGDGKAAKRIVDKIIIRYK